MFDYDITLYMIKEDLSIAKALFYGNNAMNSPVVAEMQNNPARMSYAGYFAGQALEKCLKYIVERENPNEWVDLKKTHNIPDLLTAVENVRGGFIQSHPDISYNARTLSHLNNLRYVNQTISKDNCYYLLSMAKDLHRELEQEFAKENPDKRRVERENQQHYNRKEALRLHRPKNTHYERD